MVLVEADEILRRRADLDEVAAAPRPRSATVGSPNSSVDVDRLVRLARAALLGLLDEPDHRAVPLGERRLVREACAGQRDDDERDHGEQRDEQRRGSAADKPTVGRSPVADTLGSR